MFDWCVVHAGHLGHQSSDLIAYYEAVPGVQRAPEGLNPATWMLEVTMPGNEQRLGVDFADVYQQSNLNRWAESAVHHTCMCNKSFNSENTWPYSGPGGIVSAHLQELYIRNHA